MLDYRIQTFLTLCETMNYRVTAQKLHITQPAVTQHIHYLEELYQCKLFEYNHKQLHLTKEGAILRDYSNSMNYQERKLLQALKPEEGVTLAIGATKTIGEYVLAEQIEQFLQNPANHLTVEIDNTNNILHLLDRGKIDFALVEGYFDREKYANSLYRKEAFVGFCSATHPFAGKTIPLEEILRENVIVREAGSGTRDILEQLLAGQNYNLSGFKRVTTIASFGLLMDLVARNCGITFAYRAAGKHNPFLSEFEIEGLKTEREFNYVYLKQPEDHSTPLLTHFL